MRSTRAIRFRDKAAECQRKAAQAKAEEDVRRAWLIAARDWAKMAELEEARITEARERRAELN
jgi:hypothetical protein